MSVMTEAERDTAPAPFSSMADALDATDPELSGSAPSEQGVAPAGTGTGEPVERAEATPTEQPQEIDYKAEYERLNQERVSRAAAELANAGRVKAAQREAESLKAERDEYKRLLDDENARYEALWNDAIAQAPDAASKADLQRQFALEQRARQIDQKEQQQALADKQRQALVEEHRRTNEQQARFYATAELDEAIGARAQAEGLPPAIFQPVREWVNSPAMRKLAEVLPLRVQGSPPGDPANWNLQQIGSLEQLRAHIEAQAEQGYQFFKNQHESQKIAANQEAATQTYQPERAVGAGVARPKRDLSKYRNSGNIAAVLDIEDGFDPDE